MTEITIPAGEKGAVRVFSLSLPVEEAAGLIAPKAEDALSPTTHPTAEAAARLLGTDALDTAFIELFRVKDLEGVGLADYLTLGIGIPDDDIAPDRPKLDALDGYVIVLLSAAFPTGETVLRPPSEMTLIGSYGVPKTDWTAAPIATESAKPFTGTPTAPRARRARATRVGGIIVAIVLIVFFLLIWVLL